MTDRRIPVANVYYLLCYAWRHVAESDLVRLDTLEGFEKVHDLLGSVLAQGRSSWFGAESTAVTARCERN